MIQPNNISIIDKVAEDAEIMIIQLKNFEFYLYKNRHGESGKFISETSVKKLLGSKIRVKLITKTGEVLSDNEQSYNASFGLSGEYSFKDLLCEFESYLRSKKHIYLQENVYPYI